VTLNIVPGRGDRADAQVTIVDPRRGQRQVETQALERRAETRAAEIVDKTILSEIAESGASSSRPRQDHHAQ